MNYPDVAACLVYAMIGGLAIGWIVMMFRSAYRRGKAL